MYLFDVDACPELEPAEWNRWLEEDSATPALNLALLAKLTRRLAEAWGDINYQHVRGKLSAPSIRLDGSQRRWGSWDPARRLITISTRQVLNYTWESVVETLKHEMAHQVVSELLRRDQEPSHGEAFREACRLLAADPAPRGDGGVPLFRPGGAGRALTRDDARLVKIQKLLSLADNNPAEHEARAAFARASELMLKYNLASADLERDDHVHRFLGKSSGRIPLHHYAIAGILQEFFFVQCIWVDSYVAARGVRGHRLEVMGKPANVDMAEYVYACLIRQCEALWKAFKRDRRITDRRAKREYLDGLLTGFGRQLTQVAKRSEERGLIWVGDPALGRFARRRHPRTTRSRVGGVAASEVRDRGVEAGANLRLHRPVAASRSRGRRLPG